MIKDPCMLFGDFNDSIQGGRLNYAPAHENNPTTIADQAFTEFVEVTEGTIIPPTQDTWKNPFGGIKDQETKIDFGIVNDLQEKIVEGDEDWISPLHDHARVSFTVGTPYGITSSDKLKLEQMLPLLSVVDETCTPLTLQLLDPQDPISSSDSVQQLLETLRSLFLKLTPKIHQGKPSKKH